MGNYGIKISKEGYDVKSAALENLILHSKYPFLKAKLQGSFSISITGTGTFTNTFTHNLGYHPAYVHLASVDPNNTGRRFFGRSSADGPSGSLTIDSYTTTSTLVIGWRDTTASPGGFKAYPYTVYFYYYLFYDELA